MIDTPGTVRLLIACPDARGIVAAVTGLIAEQGGNLSTPSSTPPPRKVSS